MSRGMEIEDSIMTVTEKEKAIIENPYARKGINAVWFVAACLILVLAGRIFYLDIIRGNYYQDLSRGNRIRSIAIKAPRGKIFDKFGQPLVTNIPSIDVVAIPNDLPEQSAERGKISQTLSEVLNIGLADIKNKIEMQNRKSLEPVLIKENVSQDQSLIISERLNNLPGIALENTAIRNYESSLIFSSIIGYDGKITRDELKNSEDYLMTDYIGKSGIEKYYEKNLKGVNGSKLVEVDSSENIKKNIGSKNPESGSDLYLNIDEGLQKKIYDSILEVLDQTHTKTAAAVAINPRNGKVLALVSMPSYDNNLFARSIPSADFQSLIGNKDLPLFNRVVSGEYPPGSTLKPANAAAALSEGTISSETSLDCPGSISVNTWIFKDWKAHGIMNVRRAIAESCDVFFYSVGGGYGNIPGLGIERMKKYLDLFGFGKPAGIDLPGEVSGLVPSEQWKIDTLGERWFLGDSYHTAIGQGFVTATPIQLVDYISAIANGGILYSPRIVDKIKKSNGAEETITAPVIGKNFIAPEILKIIREGMRETVTNGTAKLLNALPVAVAGKTGTAQFGAERKTHGWFVSFAPYDNPEIAMVVLVEGGGEGNSTALPITQKVLSWYFNRQQ